jgi:hypothetical protein
MITRKHLAVLAALSFYIQTAGSAVAAMTPAQKCASSKMKSSAKCWKAEAKCWTKAISNGEAVDTECLSNATGKLAADFGKIDAKGGCSTTGNAATITGKIGVSIDDVSSDLAGGGECGGSKMKAAGKAWGAKAKCHAKGLAATTNADPDCLAKAQAKYDSAFSSLDDGGDCVVTGDAPAIAAKIDDNVDDVLGDIGCGNGNLEGDESCDDEGESAGCDADCTVADCGDGTSNAAAGEGCDDGDLDETDGCTTSCVVGALCTPAAYPTLPYPTMPATKFTVSPASGHCYVGASQLGSWFDHANECQVAGGTLAVPNTASENPLIDSAKAAGAVASIGIHDTVLEGDFVSLTGESFSPDWFGGEPNDYNNEDCVIMHSPGKWSDIACTWLRDEFVCEFAP